MAKLYPPYINGTIPAFYYSEGTTQIVVPFTMNRAVATGEVAGFALKIKTINGDVKGVLQTNTLIDVTTNASVTFSTNMNFIVGQYYKVQLAYIDNSGVIGYYSTVGIIKCTTKPIVKIEGLTFGQTNTHNYSYTGTYSQFGGDVTEKMYSYKFVLYDNENNIILDSGEKIHNTSLDNNSYESHEEFLISQDLDSQQMYYIQFIITTTNKLTIHSYKYRIVQRRSVSPDINAELVANRDFDNGYIVLTMHDEIDAVISGTFLISRASSKNNFHWEELKRFELHSTPPKEWSYYDYTVEQGITYKYSLQQYNSNSIYSERIVSNDVLMDFEDMFLFDGNRQLKIRFNPKVSTFKTDVLESKTDTIGSQFPFFSRNGRVNYKEFAISGLISYLSDEKENFISMKDLGLDGFTNISDPYGRYKTTNLVDYNIAAERIFKNEVLNWLNNGEVKLFKSPTEGNFLVRLMNISLTPMDQVSRMLHSFNATAYEVADFSADTMIIYGLIDPRENLATQMHWATIDIHSFVEQYLQDNNKTLEESIGTVIQLNKRNLVSIEFMDMIPGSHIILNNENIQIGATGAFIFKTNDASISKIEYIIDAINEGQLTYGYLAQTATVFELINDIQVSDVPVRQFIGTEYLKNAKVWDSSFPYNKIYKAINGLQAGDYISAEIYNALDPTLQTYFNQQDTKYYLLVDSEQIINIINQNQKYKYTSNLLDVLNDARTTVLNVIFLRAEKRAVETLYLNTNISQELQEQILNGTTELDYTQYNFYTDMYCKDESLFDWSQANPLSLYRIRFRANASPYQRQRNYQQYIDANLDNFSQLTNTCIDGNSKKAIIYNDDLFKININNEIIDLTETEKYFLRNKDVNIYHISMNEGIILEIGYSQQIKIFNVELEAGQYNNLYNARNQYNLHLSNMIMTRNTAHYDTTNLKQAYDVYILELYKALDKYKEENGLGE